MSTNEQGPKGVGGVTTSGEKATTYVETVKAKTESEVGTSSGECHKPQYTVSGTVKASQKPIDGVSVSGGGKSTTSGPSGAYSLTFDAGATVELTFSLASYHDTKKTVGPLTGNLTKVDASVARKRWKVEGKLLYGSEERKEQRVTLNGTGLKETAKLTDNAFKFVDVPEGVPITITVTTETDYLEREPKSITLDSVTADLTDQNFTYTRKKVKITGTVKEGTKLLPGVTVKCATREDAVTKADGAFSFTELAAGEPHTLTAEHKHFTFEPVTVNTTTDRVQDLTATRKKYSIKGKVKFADEATRQVTVKAESALLTAAKTAKTGKNGAYEFADLPAGGKYTLSIAPNANYDVTSRPAPIEELVKNETDKDFEGTWKVWALSGNVKEHTRAANVNLAKVALSLSGGAEDAATTDGTGNYAFTVPAGGTYDVTPDPLPPFGFAPASHNVPNVTRATTKNFVATWSTPPPGIANDPTTTTYGLDVFKCPQCQGRPMAHGASPLRETQTSYDKCKELYLIIRTRQSTTKTMVGVLVCDDNGTEKYLAAHSGGDAYPAGWQTTATAAGFVVATYVAPADLRSRGGNALASTAQAGNNEVGNCAAPKLIQAANANGWTPLGMTEMSLNLEGYTTGKTISSCKTCQLIVAQMLCDA